MIPVNKRKIGVCILLSVVTFGIYQIYWEYLLVKNTRAIQKDESSCTGEMLCLVFVPFYSLFWWITRGKIVKEKFAEHSYSAIGNEIVYLILGIFGLDIVSMAIMQNDFNSVESESTQSIQRSALNGIRKIGKAFKSLKWYEIVMCVIMLAISIYYVIFPREDMPRWLAIINFISGLCGIMCVFFCAKANRMNFPFAVVNTTVFMIYLAYFGIWATFWLEAIVYTPLNIFSWIKWYQHKDEEDELLAKSKKLTWWQHLIVFAVIAAITVLVYYALSVLAGDTWMSFAADHRWNITVMKWLDSAIFSIGIVASILELLRYKEQYVWWLVTDVFAVAQYAIKVDPVYTTKKAIYLVEAVVGFRNWHLLSKRNKTNE